MWGPVSVSVSAGGRLEAETGRGHFSTSSRRLQLNERRVLFAPAERKLRQRCRPLNH